MGLWSWIKATWGLFIITIIVLLFFGYCANIVKLAKCDFSAPYKAEVLRGVGVFPVVPMGAVLGWLDIED